MTPIPGVSRHARDRAAERLGRELSRAEWLSLVANIIDGRAALLVRGGDAVEMYLVAVGSIAVKVRWCPFSAQVVTVLPDDAHPTSRGYAE